MERAMKLGQREAALVLSKRVPVRLANIGNVLGSSFGEVYGHLEGCGIRSTEPPFVIYHGTPAAGEPFDVEVCAPVAATIDPPAGWQAQELPAGLFLTHLHVGPYETVRTAYEAMGAWIADHGLAMAGPPREVYLSEPGTPPEQVRTIIEVPVVEVAAPVAGT